MLRQGMYSTQSVFGVFLLLENWNEVQQQQRMLDMEELSEQNSILFQ